MCIQYSKYEEMLVTYQEQFEHLVDTDIDTILDNALEVLSELSYDPDEELGRYTAQVIIANLEHGTIEKLEPELLRAYALQYLYDHDYNGTYITFIKAMWEFLAENLREGRNVTIDDFILFIAKYRIKQHEYVS